MVPDFNPKLPHKPPLCECGRYCMPKFTEVTDHMHKVLFFEKEGDKVSTRLKMAIFAGELDLAHKAQLRNFVEHIDDIADTAEDVADRLAIYAIKRSH